MTLDEIEAWMRRMQEAGLSELEFEAGDQRLFLRAHSSGPAHPPSVPTQAGAESVPIRAPQFGLFRATHPQRDAPNASEGDSVSEGSIVAYVEAGAVLHPVVAERAGVLGACLVEDGALVGYAQPLFKLG